MGEAEDPIDAGDIQAGLREGDGLEWLTSALSSIILMAPVVDPALEPRLDRGQQHGPIRTGDPAVRSVVTAVSGGEHLAFGDLIAHHAPPPTRTNAVTVKVVPAGCSRHYMSWWPPLSAYGPARPRRLSPSRSGRGGI